MERRPGIAFAFALALALALLPATASGQQFEFLSAADSRSNPDTFERNVRSMLALAPNAIAFFNGGDITADGDRDQWDDHHAALASGAPDGDVPADPTGIVRQSWFRTDVDDWGRYVRYFGVVGNHDVHSSSWLQNWNDYLSGQSGLGVNGADGVYFYVTYEHAIFIVLDSEHPSAEQTLWLEQVLRSPVADKTWKFVFFHDPVYPCNDKSPFDEGIEWVELFEAYGVDVAFVSHSHTYERTCPMIGGRCADGGVVYLNTSGAGASARAVDETKTDFVAHGDREDYYDCAQILSSAKGEWNYFCRVAIDGCSAAVDCYSDGYADSGEAPYDRVAWVKPECGDGGGGGGGGPGPLVGGVSDGDEVFDGEGGGVGGDGDGAGGGDDPRRSTDLIGGCGVSREGRGSGGSALLALIALAGALQARRRQTKRRDGR